MRGRYDISKHSRRGALKRKISNFQPPAVKKACSERSKDVCAVVIILASDSCGLRFPQQSCWREWANSSDNLGFAVYAEDHKALQEACTLDEWEFWRPFMCPVQSSSAWGEFSLVTVELLALIWALKRFSNASWFYVVSGDSIPTKSPEVYARGPLNGKSVLGYVSVTDEDSLFVDVNGSGEVLVRDHSQWKVLSRKHVSALETHFLSLTVHWKEAAKSLKIELCCGIVPDEWVIGTFLFKVDPRSLCFVSESIMGQEFVYAKSPCCGNCIGHADVLVGLAFERMFRHAFRDDGTFALRKVTHKVGHKSV